MSSTGSLEVIVNRGIKRQWLTQSSEKKQTLIQQIEIVRSKQTFQSCYLRTTLWATDISVSLPYAILPIFLISSRLKVKSQPGLIQHHGQRYQLSCQIYEEPACCVKHMLCSPHSWQDSGTSRSDCFTVLLRVRLQPDGLRIIMFAGTLVASPSYS